MVALKAAVRTGRVSLQTRSTMLACRSYINIEKFSFPQFWGKAEDAELKKKEADIKMQELELQKMKMNIQLEELRLRSQSEQAEGFRKVEEEKTLREKMQMEYQTQVEKNRDSAKQKAKEAEHKIEQEKNLRLRMENAAMQKDEDKRTLAAPRNDMLKQAHQIAQTNVCTKVMEDLQVEGFTFHMAPVYLVVDKGSNIAQHVSDALKNLPGPTQQAVANLMAGVRKAYGTETLFTFEDGKGTYTNVVYKREETDEQVSMALMPFGMGFECAKVVDKYIDHEWEEAVWESQPHNVIDEGGWVLNKYKTVWKDVKVGTVKKKKREPVFKKKILDAAKMKSVMDAMEFQACGQVLKALS